MYFDSCLISLISCKESRAPLLPSKLEMVRIETRGMKKLLPALEILQVHLGRLVSPPHSRMLGL